MTIGDISRAILIAQFPRHLGNSFTYTFYQSLPAPYQGVNIPPALQGSGGQQPAFSTIFDPILTGDGERAISAAAFAMFGTIINATFTETTNVNATFGIAALNFNTPAAGAWASPGNQAAVGAEAGDIWLTAGARDSQNASMPGTGAHQDYIHNTIPHEIGHALGLSHTHDDNVGVSTPIAGLLANENNTRFSIMAYNQHPTENHAVYELQLYDIAALQSLYGINTTATAGASTYNRFHENNPGDGTVQDRVFAIWDGQGVDTIDASNAQYLSSFGTSGSLIDLRPGHFSSIGLNSHVNIANGAIQAAGDENVAVAFGAYIENATGGARDDALIGNLLSNVLIGGAGKDLIYGEGRLRPDQQQIPILAGLGAYDGDYRQIGTSGIGAVGAEALAFVNDRTHQKDKLFGGDGDDQLWGGRGDDELWGGIGSDLIYGWDGDDTVVYGRAAETDPETSVEITVASMSGSGTDARITANANAPDSSVKSQFTITEGTYTDTLVDIETIKLTDLSDTIRLTGSLGAFDAGDVTIDMRGAPTPAAHNHDIIDASNATAGVYINLGNGSVTGLDLDSNLDWEAWARDLDQILQQPDELRIINGNQVVGTQYSDFLVASWGAQGSGEGYSALYGGAGNDLLVGGGWESHLYGGAGDDQFVVGAGVWIEDGQTGDRIHWAGHEIFGGVNQWWMTSNTAFWSPFSSITSAFVSVGTVIITAVAALVDVPLMKFASFQQTVAGDLVVYLAWGHGGKAVIKDYEVDLKTGSGTAGVTVFQSSLGWIGNFSLEKFNEYVNLALMAGFGRCLKGYDPLVLDLDGDGFDLIGERVSQIYLEFDADGFAERTGWVHTDDALLSIDLNANGIIDGVSELFGNATMSGFTMLSAYDLNLDGVINASDAVYANLRVWRDLDQDGISDAGELQTLAEAGIASIGLDSVEPEEPLEIGGNDITRVATFTRTDGSTSGIADVTFNINQTATRWLGDNSVSSAAAALPELMGFGEVKTLRVAMTGDSVLLDMVDDFAGQTSNDLATLKAEAEAILYRWAGVDDVAAGAIGTNGFDARKLAFLELYSGYELMPRDTNGDVLTTNVTEMEALWADQVTRLTLRLVVQGPMADEFDGISYRTDLDMLVADTPSALADLYAELLEDLPSDPVDALAEWQAWAPLLGAMADGMTRSTGAVVRDDYIAVQLYAAMDGIAQPLDFETLAGALGLDNLRIGSTAGETLTRGSAEGGVVYLSEGGTDIVNGGTGQDVYILGHTIGHVTINDEEGKQAGDRLRFAFHTAEEVSLERDGNDLLITVTATGETVRVTGQFAPVVPLGPDTFLSSNKGIEEIEFGDGQLMEIPDIMTAVGTGSDGNDHLVGTMHSDVLLGGLGDDLLEGGDDADLYVVHAGGGHDVIREVQTTVLLRAADLVIFGEGIAPGDLVFARLGGGGDDLLISIGGSSQTLLIEGQFGYTSLGYNDRYAPNARIEAFAFHDYGEGWGIRELQQKIIADTTTAGDDETRGFGDDDYFGASAGNDLLIGMDGQDRYQWGAGAGNDRIDEQSRYIDINVGLGGLSLSLEADTVELKGLVQANIVFSRTAANDLLVTIISTGETLTIVDQFAGFQTGPLGAQWLDRIEWFEFADNTRISWQAVLADITTGGDGNDSLYGDLYADRFEGGLGNDRLSGRGYGDTYVFGLGDGHDTLADDNASLLGEGFVTLDTNPDILEFGTGIAENDITFERNGDDVTLVIGGAGDRVTLEDQDDYFHTGVFGAVALDRIEEIHFDSGAVWTWQQLNGRIISAATSSGNDTIQGFMMADRFEASAGDDVLAGRDSGDTYVFGPGSGHDVIQESVSNVLYGDFDIVEFGSTVLPIHVVFSRAGSDLVVTLSGGDTLTIDGQFDYQAFYTWTDIELFRFGNGTEWTKADVQAILLTPTSGNDHLIGFSSDDLLDGAAGNDILEGADGSDTYHFGLGGGSDIIRESLGNTNLGEFDRVVFGAGILVSDVDFSRDEDDLIATIVSTGQTLTIEGHFSFSNWFAWNDIEQFSFANGTNLSDLDVAALILGGTPGNDHLIGTFRSDTLDGGAGNDILEGGDGADRYLFGLGYGQDEIRETLSNANLSENDQLEFGAGIVLSDLNFTRSGDDLLITIDGVSDSLLIDNQFAYSNWFTWWDIDRFLFADGSALTKEEVQQIVLTPTAGADHMFGFMTGDTLDGGAGNDILEGGDGADTYVFGLGYGQDEIVETLGNANLSENDTLRFGAGIEWEDLQFSRSGDTLIIGIAGTSDTITIENQWTTITDTSTQTWWDVENFDFAGGVHKTAADVMAALLQGTAGNDHLIGFYVADTLEGGAGDDLLEGGRANDLYIHNLGDGHDTIADFVYYWGSSGDTLRFGAGIAPSDVTVRRSLSDADDMVLSVNNGQSSVTLKNQINGGSEWTIDTVEFQNGTTWSITQLANMMLAGTATNGNDVIVGTSLADQLFGGPGNDTLRGEGGDDTLDGGADTDTIEGGDGNDTLKGGTGTDLLKGANGADTYVYNLGDGDETIYDYANSDWPGWGWPGTDKLVFGAGIAVSDLIFSRVTTDSNDMRITFVGQTGSILIDNQNWGDAGIEEVRFADGTVWNIDQLNARYLADQKTAGNDTIWGTNHGDTADGGAGNDSIETRDGNDTLKGGTGDDWLAGGYGADTYIYNLGDGDDTIFDYADGDTSYWGWPGTDKLVFGAGITASDLIFSAVSGNTNAIRISFVGSAGSIFIDRQNWGDAGIEEVQFANGTVWNLDQLNARYLADQKTSGNDTIWGTNHGDPADGGAGNDSIQAGDGNDTLTGGTGDDWLSGGYGSDSYIYNLGDGDDTIYDYANSDWSGWGWPGPDKLVLGAGIAPGDLLFSSVSGNTNAIRISFIGQSGSIFLDRQNWGDAGIEEIRFANGTVWNLDQLNARYLADQKTSGNDTIWGTNHGDTANGGGGNDTLETWDGNDTLAGETGNDWLSGGYGADVYVYNLGDGDDTIYDYANTDWSGWGWPGPDKLVFGAGITANDLIFSRVTADSNDMRISFVGQSGSILIDNQNWGDAGIEAIEFAGGTIWDLAQLTARYVADQGTAGNDIIWGSYLDDNASGGDGDDTIEGRDGNDILTGSGGADTLVGGAGADRLIGGDGADTLTGSSGVDTFVFGPGSTGLGSAADRITDFVVGTDKIDLSAIDADMSLAGDQAFVFVGSSAFSNTAGELRYVKSGGETWLQFDRDGDGIANLEIVLSGAPTVLASDFVL